MQIRSDCRGGIWGVCIARRGGAGSPCGTLTHQQVAICLRGVQGSSRNLNGMLMPLHERSTAKSRRAELSASRKGGERAERTPSWSDTTSFIREGFRRGEY